MKQTAESAMDIPKIRSLSSQSWIEERLQLEEKLEDIIFHVKNIFVKKKKPDLGKFLKLYEESAGRIVDRFLEPLKLRFLSRLPEAREHCFLSLCATKIKGTKLVSFSSICSSLTETLPIKIFIFNNAVAASTLLLMRLSALYVAMESYGCAEWAFHLLLNLSDKYMNCCSSKHSSILFDYIVYFYMLPSKFQRYPHKLNKKCETLDSEDRKKVERLRLVEDVFLKDFIPNTEIISNPFYLDLHKECSDNHHLWLAQTMKFWQEQSTHEEMSERLRNLHSSEEATRIVNFAAHIFSELLELGDYLLASVSAWVLVKMFFLLSYLAQDSIAAALKSTAKILLDFAESLEYVASMCGERYGLYHETLLQQGSMVHDLLVALEDEEELAASILQLLDEKICDDELARNLTMPLVKKVAYYDRQSRYLQSDVTPRREDILDILLYMRLLNPRSTTLALDVILYQHRCLMYRFKYGPASTMRTTLKVLFNFQLLAYPVLRNELFIRSNLTSIYFISRKFATAQKVLINFPPLSDRLHYLRSLWKNIYLNAVKKESTYTSMDVNGNYLNARKYEKLIEKNTNLINNRDINVALSNIDYGERPVLGNKEDARCYNDEDDHCNEADAHCIGREYAYCVDGEDAHHVKGENAHCTNGKDTRWVNGNDDCRVNGEDARCVNDGEVRCDDGSDPSKVNREYAHCINGKVTKVLNGEMPNILNGEDSVVLSKNCTSDVNERNEESANLIDEDSNFVDKNFDLNTEHTSLLKPSERLLPLDRSKELARDVWRNLMSEGKRCVELVQSADPIIAGGSDEDIGSRYRQQRGLLRSKEQVMVVCQNITYDLVNNQPEKMNIPCEIQQLQVLRQNFIECLGLLIKEANKTSCKRSVNHLNAPLDDVIKLKDMYLSLIKTTENDLEHLVNWMESIESYL